MPNVKGVVQQQFSAVAEQYRTSQVHALGADLAHIEDYVKQHTAPLVLDVGCGAGHVTRIVAPHSQAVVAFDLTAAMLEQVDCHMQAHQITNVRTQQGDVEQLPFADGTFDLVVSRYSAHHWPDPLRAVGECLRVLKPRGSFLLSDIVVPNAPAVDSFIQAIEILRDQSHVRDHRIAEWCAMFEEHHATIQVLNTWEVALDFVAWVQRMATPSDRVAILQSLLATASHEISSALAIRSDHSFTLQGALICGIVSHR